MPNLLGNLSQALVFGAILALSGFPSSANTKIENCLWNNWMSEMNDTDVNEGHGNGNGNGNLGNFNGNNNTGNGNGNGNFGSHNGNRSTINCRGNGWLFRDFTNDDRYPRRYRNKYP